MKRRKEGREKSHWYICRTEKTPGKISLLREVVELISLVQKQSTSLGGELCQNSWLPDSQTRQAIRTHKYAYIKEEMKGERKMHLDYWLKTNPIHLFLLFTFQDIVFQSLLIL